MWLAGKQPNDEKGSTANIIFATSWGDNASHAPCNLGCYTTGAGSYVEQGREWI